VVTRDETAWTWWTLPSAIAGCLARTYRGYPSISSCSRWILAYRQAPARQDRPASGPRTTSELSEAGQSRHAGWLEDCRAGRWRPSWSAAIVTSRIAGRSCRLVSPRSPHTGPGHDLP